MKSLDEFNYYVAVTPQSTLSVIAFCPKCGSTIMLTDLQQFGPQSLTGHQCYQKIVSVPK
jgi:hypothetical protein